MRRGAKVVIVLLVIILVTLLAMRQDVREILLALWRTFRYPFGFALGALLLATMLDRKRG